MIHIEQTYPSILPVDYAQLKFINPYSYSQVNIFFTIRRIDNTTETPTGEELFSLHLKQVTSPLTRVFSGVDFDYNLNPTITEYSIDDSIMQYPYSSDTTLGYSYSIHAIGGLLWFYIKGSHPKSWSTQAFILGVYIDLSATNYI